ncbi:5788_t:CDS:2, partial [Ambispora leptoticha]
LSEPSKEEVISEPAQSDPNNPITKYQQRIAKTEAINHAKSTSSSEQSESTSALKGFYEESLKDTVETKTNEFKSLDADYRTLLSDIENQYAEEALPDEETMAEEITL